MIPRNILFLFFLSLFFLKKNYAQDSLSSRNICPNKNAIGFELGGTALMYSVYYEREVASKGILCQSVKAGISKSFIPGVDQFFLPFDYNLYWGHNKIKFLVGPGITLLISPSPSPSSASSRQDYKNIYQTNPNAAVSKYSTDHYEQLLDFAYTAKIGLAIKGERINWHFYYNCFLIRLNMHYYFQPLWMGVGFSFNLGKNTSK